VFLNRLGTMNIKFLSIPKNTQDALLNAFNFTYPDMSSTELLRSLTGLTAVEVRKEEVSEEVVLALVEKVMHVKKVENKEKEIVAMIKM